MNVYEPAEDSFLLFDCADSVLKKDGNILDVCEVGVGSGYVLLNVARRYPKKNFYGTDINPYAIKHTKKEAKRQKIRVFLKQTNLLESFRKQFDLVLFNSPYLPVEKGERYENLTMKDKAIYSKKYGYEHVCELILQLVKSLNERGVALIVFSSLSNLKHIKGELDRNLFEYEIFGEEKVFFEKIYCIKVWKSRVLNDILKIGIKDLNFFAKGKHSVVFDGKYRNKEVVVKIGDEQFIRKEAMFLKKLQNLSFVPKLYFSAKRFVVMEKARGQQIFEFFESATKKEIKIILRKLVLATLKLDSFKINKFELTNPYKHIFVDERLKLKFIDFERCIFSMKPKNTRQILQYFRRNLNLFEKKGLKIDEKELIGISERYKKEGRRRILTNFFK